LSFVRGSCYAERMRQALVVSVVLAGCAGYSTHPNVHGKIPETTAAELFERAAVDLDCPSESVHLTRRDDQSVGATGCERELVYLMTVSGEWMLDSPDGKAIPRAGAPAHAAEPPPPAAPPPVSPG